MVEHERSQPLEGGGSTRVLVLQTSEKSLCLWLCFSSRRCPGQGDRHSHLVWAWRRLLGHCGDRDGIGGGIWDWSARWGDNPLEERPGSRGLDTWEQKSCHSTVPDIPKRWDGINRICSWHHSGKKRAHQHKPFGPVPLGTTPVMC